MEVIYKLNTMEANQKRNRHELKSLTCEVASLRKENAALRDEVFALKDQNHTLEKMHIRLEKENQLLRNDNERMKRTLNNDSSNSSVSPSQEQKRKSPNQYNSRQQTSRKAGAQPGHKGHSLTRKEVEEKIRCGLYGHRVEESGEPGRAYVSRYRLDLDIQTVATEIRIHADENGKYSFIRNFITEKSVVFYSSKKKNLETRGQFRILKEYTGTLTHDHETALYHLGTGHRECNVHLCRYLQKNMEETPNKRSRNMRSFMNGMNEAQEEKGGRVRKFRGLKDRIV